MIFYFLYPGVPLQGRIQDFQIEGGGGGQKIIVHAARTPSATEARNPLRPWSEPAQGHWKL